MLFWIWVAAILGAITLYLRQAYSRFSKYGVKHLTPVPFLGNSAFLFLRTKHFSEALEEIYNSFPNERFVGNYDFVFPTIFIRDPELLKKITVKDFEYFLDHKMTLDENIDPLFGRNLFSLKGREWKDMRSTLSPAFTSSKIRLMVPFMVEVGDQMIKALKNKIKNSEEDYIDVDMKDITARYANDVIATCAFGLKVDSHADEQNQFYVMGKEFTNFKFKQMLIMVGMLWFPKIMKRLKVTLFPEKLKKFFTHLVLDTMEDREVRKIFRPDMIHLLMEAKKGTLSHDDDTTADDASAGFATVEESAVGKKDVTRVWSDTDLIAQAILFFIAGFETISSTMTFLMYELAVNPEVQEKLFKEIKENDKKNGGKFDYNSVQRMTYLDMVVSEVLRLWPPAVGVDRNCLKDYNLGKPNDQATEDYIIRKGEGVMIAQWAFHRDPEYFPDPLKFDPERFSEENKHNIKPFTYMPFGLGPRNCIGSRFALCEVKVMAYQLLLNMEVSPAAKTQIPVKLSKNMFGLRMEGGHWIRLRPRV